MRRPLDRRDYASTKALGDEVLRRVGSDVALSDGCWSGKGRIEEDLDLGGRAGKIEIRHGDKYFLYGGSVLDIAPFCSWFNGIEWTERREVSWERGGGQEHSQHF